jgi:hypothetical protein
MMDHKKYNYVGSVELLELLHDPSERINISISENLEKLFGDLNKSKKQTRVAVFTFIVDKNGDLWLADRHSEHVVCARGEKVLAAGEITLEIDRHIFEIIAITNQSTGYCPEPSSWTALAQTLQSLEVKFPNYWTTVFDFRRCSQCSTISIVKQDVYECAVCENFLSKEWNF